jgi:homopolymeric O-antigen transport system permease protein
MYSQNYVFLLRNLVSRDFKVRYRNMSLGIFWSLLSPLVMMGVLTFIFTVIIPSPIENFYLAALTGIVIFNFFALSWLSATVSIYSNTGLVKRVPMPRELLPVATVLAASLHFLIQLGLVVILTLLAGYELNRYWLILPLVLGCEVIFVCGLSLVTAAMDVYYRDIRYVVESLNTVLFWLVPIFYSFSMVPQEYKSIYEYNPIAAVVLAVRAVMMEGRMPPTALLIKLPLVSFATLALGYLIFRRLKRNFADYL